MQARPCRKLPRTRVAGTPLPPSRPGWYRKKAYSSPKAITLCGVISRNFFTLFGVIRQKANYALQRNFGNYFYAIERNLYTK
jgi:hypothetical protein